MRRARTQHIRGCSTSSRHWFTLHSAQGGGPGAKCAICKHACGAVHPNILRALETGLLYANLYTPAGDGDEYDQNAREIERHRDLIRDAIARIRVERGL